MKKKTRKIIGIAIILLIVIAVGISKGKDIYENSHVKFADDNMGKTISSWAKGPGITPGNVTYKEIDTVKRLNIGFSGNYKTIKDIQHCKKVESLYINVPFEEKALRDFGEVEGTERKLSEKELAVLQEELAEILAHLSQLEMLYIGEKGGNNLTSIDFLKDCTQIKKIWLEGVKATDYSALKTCSSLEEIYIFKSEISKADDLAGLKNLKTIVLYQTPLLENAKEIKKLQKMYPNVDIKKKQVTFEDSTMGELLCGALEENITPENVMYKDLRDIRKLNIGYSGYYETIADI